MRILKGKIAAVTGGGSGIGRAIAISLASAGAKVAILDINQKWGDKVSEEIVTAGGEAISIKLDVINGIEIKKAVKKIVDTWSKLDVWVNNAGLSTMKYFLDLTEIDWDYILNVNAKGTFLCTQIAAKQMVKQNSSDENGIRGKIINIASMAGKRGNAPFLAHYVASKFAVVGLTQAAAGELAKFGITVNAVCPGYVKTSMQQREVSWESKLRRISEKEVIELYLRDTPLNRLAAPEDIAGTVLFLASPSADFITGACIHVNGGAWME